MPSSAIKSEGRYRTWHFTSVLKSSVQINVDFVANSTLHSLDDMGDPIQRVRGYIEKQISSENKPDCVTFVHWRFSRKDVAGWISHAAARPSLPDLPFEGYIQSESIGLNRLHRWLQDAIWSSVGEKLSENTAYKQFCMADPAYEYCQYGKPALARAGRPAKKHAPAPPRAPSPPPAAMHPPPHPSGAEGGRQGLLPAVRPARPHVAAWLTLAEPSAVPSRPPAHPRADRPPAHPPLPPTRATLPAVRPARPYSRRSIVSAFPPECRPISTR